MRVRAMGGGWEKVNDNWRLRQVVPPRLRPFLPPPYNTSGRRRDGTTGVPASNITFSSRTGNKAEAMAVARREGFEAKIQRILDHAEKGYQAWCKDKGIDWQAMNDRAELDHLLIDHGDAEAAYHRRQAQEKGDPVAAAVAEQLAVILKGMGLELPDSKPAKPVSFVAIWQGWQERNGAADTKTTYKTIFCEDAKGRVSGLRKHVGHDNAAAVTSEDIEAYRKGLETAGKSEATVHNHLTAFSVLFNFGVTKKLVKSSPMKGVTIGKKPESDRAPYTRDDVKKIVLEGRSQPDEIRIPTLIASYGGERLAEVLDARTQDITQIEGVWCLSIRLKHRKRAGLRLKTRSSTRDVPLHPSIVETVLAYRDRIVAEHGEGPLFPQFTPDEQGRRAKAGGKRIAKWIRRDLQISDPDIGPMHSFRHYLRSAMLAAKVDRKIRDAITGHTGSGDESEKYEHVEMAMKVAAIATLCNPLAEAGVIVRRAA